MRHIKSSTIAIKWYGNDMEYLVCIYNRYLYLCIKRCELRQHFSESYQHPEVHDLAMLLKQLQAEPQHPAPVPAPPKPARGPVAMRRVTVEEVQRYLEEGEPFILRDAMTWLSGLNWRSLTCLTMIFWDRFKAPSNLQTIWNYFCSLFLTSLLFSIRPYTLWMSPRWRESLGVHATAHDGLWTRSGDLWDPREVVSPKSGCTLGSIYPASPAKRLSWLFQAAALWICFIFVQTYLLIPKREDVTHQTRSILKPCRLTTGIQHYILTSNKTPLWATNSRGNQ